MLFMQVMAAVTVGGHGHALEPAGELADDPTRPLVAYDARVAGDEQRTRLVMEFQERPVLRVRYLGAPERIVIELPETAFGFTADKLPSRGLFSSIRYGKSGAGRSRIVLGLAAPARLDLAETQVNESGGGFRMVLDAVAVDGPAFAELAAGSDWFQSVSEKGGRPAQGVATGKHEFTVVIDAGHGGIDGGAEGAGGAKEKDVTLAFALALQDKLAEFKGINVVMTREDDTFLSLSGRVRIAREKEANLLISLHADSIAQRYLRGATVYTLSDRASDAISASLAEQENRGDGIVGANLEDANGEVAGILVDLARSETRVISTGLAENVIRSFQGQVKLINNPHRQAGFRVLQAPDVPSALVELGYLSNPEDEKLLTDAEWLENTAGLLARSVDDFRHTVLAEGQ